MIEDIARALQHDTERWNNMSGKQWSEYRQVAHQRTDKWTSRFAKAWEYYRSLAPGQVRELHHLRSAKERT